MFFVASAEQLNIATSSQTRFHQYLDAIKDKIGHEVPYRKKLLEINRVRIASKHDGILPDKKELQTYLEAARQFFDESTSEIFGVDFWSISLIDLLDTDREETTLLKQAESHFKKEEFYECLIRCRRAFYVVFEELYNIKKFEKDDPKDFFRSFGVNAPSYAQSADYIRERVSDPFGYIVRDHSKIDADLTKEGIDHTTFWNVWRLTPEVYRYSKEDEWLTKEEPEKYEQGDLKGTAAYVLDATISMMLQLTINRSEWRTLGSSTTTLTLRPGVIRMFAKADRDSAVTQEFEVVEGTSVIGNHRTPGLNRDDNYWSITAFNRETKLFAFGYVPEEDVVSVEHRSL